MHTFWDTKKSADEVDEILADMNDDANDNESNDNEHYLDNEIKDCNWINKILAALENLEINIKKENVKSEIWVCLNDIRLYF